jgi:hypothetical protein
VDKQRLDLLELFCILAIFAAALAMFAKGCDDDEGTMRPVYAAALPHFLYAPCDES